MSAAARTFSFESMVPAAISRRAITTSSCGCRRMVRSAACSTEWLSASVVVADGFLRVLQDTTVVRGVQDFLQQRPVLGLSRAGQRLDQPRDLVPVVRVLPGRLLAHLLLERVQHRLVVDA